MKGAFISTHKCTKHVFFSVEAEKKCPPFPPDAFLFLQNTEISGKIGKNIIRKVFDIHDTCICHGNICRSPMAEYLFRDMVEKRGLSAQFHIASAATSREEIGNGVYPPAKRKLASVGISCTMHHARQVTKEDYAAYDYLLVAERYNIPNLMRQIKEDSDHKVYRLLDFSSRPRDIADPWYTGDFDITYHDITEGLEGFLAYLKKENKL